MQSDRAEMRVLITGARGFVGPHVAKALRRICGPDTVILATSRESGEHPALGMIEALDVTEDAAVSASIAHYNPTHIIHLAGIAAPAVAGANPDEAWRVHVRGARNLGQAILRNAPDCWLLHIGSGMVYGETAKPGLPLREDALLAPIDEYAVTKAAADLALGALKRQGLKCVRFRPFNHTGPGQTSAFVVPAFAKQIAMIEAGHAPPIIRVGNLDPERDFLDVRDVANSYALAVQNSESLEAGVVLNVASGVPRSIKAILDGLLAQSRVEVTIELDQERMRPSDLQRIVGDAGRARKSLMWAPEHAFEDTLATVLDDWRARVARSVELE